MSKCADTETCDPMYIDKKCAPININPLGNPPIFRCAYTDGPYIYLCSPGCCSGGYEGTCIGDRKPEPVCSDIKTCSTPDAPCECLTLSGNRKVCANRVRTKQGSQIVDTITPCNPGCCGGACKGPCPGGTPADKSPPNPSVVGPFTGSDLREPIGARYMMAIAILLLFLVLASTVCML
jgi:hypothetical protein